MTSELGRMIMAKGATLTAGVVNFDHVGEAFFDTEDIEGIPRYKIVLDSTFADGGIYSAAYKYALNQRLVHQHLAQGKVIGDIRLASLVSPDGVMMVQCFVTADSMLPNALLCELTEDRPPSVYRDDAAARVELLDQIAAALEEVEDDGSNT